MKYFFSILLIMSAFLGKAEAVINYPEIVIGGQEATLEIEGLRQEDQVFILIGDQKLKAEIVDSTSKIPFTISEEKLLTVQVNGTTVSEKEINPIPLWMSLIPPLIAIILALLVREVISALLIGIFSGAVIIFLHSYGFLEGWLFAFMATIDTYILGALNNSGHLSIIVFSLLIGGMVSVISKNGGMQGVVNRISKYANSPKSGQLATWLLGIAIFFDDYANTLIVGNTMRPVTDRLKISREKLAYIVDSTAAPIAAIAFVTTWIGAELGYLTHFIPVLYY